MWVLNDLRVFHDGDEFLKVLAEEGQCVDVQMICFDDR